MGMEQSGPSDEQTALLVQKGQKEYFDLLMERYEKKLLRYGRKFLSDKADVEDIVQDVFMSAYQNIKSFDVSQRFSPWIYRIAHNAFVTELKKSTKRPILLFDFDTLLSHTASEDTARSKEEEAEMRGMIETGLKELPLKYREVLILYYLEELPYKEIADVLQIPTSTAGIRLKRARILLKDAYAKMNITYEH